MTYVLTSAKLNSTGLRWVSELADYDFTIKYRPGKIGNDADGLSRNPVSVEEMEKNCTMEIDPANLSVVMSTEQGVGCCSLSADKLEFVPREAVIPVDKAELINQQVDDQVVGPVYKAVILGKRPGKLEWTELDRKAKVLFQQYPKLEIKDGLLLRKTSMYNQIVLPEKYHQLVFSELHEKMAHLASDRVEDLARQRFYWPYMSKDIEDYIRKRCSCVISKKPNKIEKAPLVPIEASYPFEMVSIAFRLRDVTN